MTTDTTLIEKREELKRRLAAGEYKTLVDVLFDGMSRIMQKITRNSRPISPWYSSAILWLIILLSGIVALFLMGDAPAFMGQFARFPRGFFPLFLSLSYFSIASMVAGNIYVHRVFTIFRDSVLDAADSIATMEDLERWLTSVCSRKIHFITSVVGGVLLGIYLLFVGYARFGFFTPFSMATSTLLVNIGNFAFLYLLLYMVVLSARIGRYHLKLYETDPAGSEVISRLAGVLGSFVYLIAIYGAFSALAFVLSGLLIVQVVAIFVPLYWIPIIAMFVLNQSNLSSIIRTAKWKTLNEIQARIERLHASEKLGEKDTMETINRLMDYYDRIKNTRSSRIDLEAVLHLFNSLLLPLLALVLGNLDKLIALLPQRP